MQHQLARILYPKMMLVWSYFQQFCLKSILHICFLNSCCCENRSYSEFFPDENFKLEEWKLLLEKITVLFKTILVLNSLEMKT